MRYLIILLIALSCWSCSTPSISLPNLPTTTSKEVSLAGKWSSSTEKYTIYIEDELEKIVISNGCEVISANYKKYLPAMTFTNIIKTQNTCNQSTSTIDQVLKQTLFIKKLSNNQIGFYNEKEEELLILSKN